LTGERKMAEWSDELVDDLIVRVSESERSRKHPRRLPLKVGALLAVLIVSGVVIGAVNLFNQTLPEHTVGAVLTADCSTPLVSSSQASGVVLYRCAPTNGAFTVTTTGSASWTHTGLDGYSKLKIVESTAGVPVPPVTTDCDVIDSIDITGTSGGPQPFTSGQEYVYCAEYTNPGAFGPITVTWTQ
jgi:hypothetical protein